MSPKSPFIRITSPIILSIFLLLGLANTLHQAHAADGVIYVNHAATGNSDGSSWADAFTSLQDALISATAPAEVWVATGVYTPGTTVSDTFQLKAGVQLFGGFVATETARSERNWAANATVLSGDIAGDDTAEASGIVSSTTNISGTNSYHVVTGSGVTSTAIIDGFTISAGRTLTSSVNNSSGGGMLNNNGNPTLQNISFIGNFADTGGAMANIDNSHPILLNVRFENNRSAFSGGGMYNENSSPSLENVTFFNNQTAKDGGGIDNTINSNPSLINVTIHSNSAGRFGGGMINSNGSLPTLNAVVISGNSAAIGGGMANSDDGSPTMFNVVFSGNSATQTGGAIYNNFSYPILQNTTLSGNSAGENGGAIHNSDSSSSIIINSILWNNQAAGSSQTLTATIANTGFSTATVSASIVQNSGSSQSWQSQLGADGGNNLDIDPLFVTEIPLASVPTQDGDLSLQSGSPAIDAGNTLSYTSLIMTDAAGNARIFNAAIDIGAYEFDPANTTVDTFTVYLPLIVKPAQ